MSLIKPLLESVYLGTYLVFVVKSGQLFLWNSFYCLINTWYSSSELYKNMTPIFFHVRSFTLSWWINEGYLSFSQFLTLGISFHYLLTSWKGEGGHYFKSLDKTKPRNEHTLQRKKNTLDLTLLQFHVDFPSR